MQLAVQATCEAQLLYRHATEAKRTNISNKRDIVKNSHCQEVEL